jgi:UPF0755 protein
MSDGALTRGGARTLALVGVVLLGLIGCAAVGLLAYVGPMNTPGGVIRLHEGEGAEAVAATLERAGLVASRRAFVVCARLTGEDRKLRAGRYLIPPGQSIRSLLALLSAGPNLRELFTIREGARAEEIGNALHLATGVDSTAFMKIVLDPASPARFSVAGPTLEGYLFPETYELPWGLTAEEAITIFVKEYHEAIAGLGARSDSLGLSERQVVTLASIIEAETGVPEERARVAAVFHNRLREGWKLEADPTVRYATRNQDSSLTITDLQNESPYNTYVHPGLPPGPICSPGRAALDAALYPIVPSEEFFFVATGEGGHHFSRTIDEHNAAKALAKRKINGS